MSRGFQEIEEPAGEDIVTVQEDILQATGEYLRQIMRVEFSKFLDRDLYERTEDEPNHRNVSYSRRFAPKRTGEVLLRVSRDRKSNHQTQVLPRS
jgi:transposase-like protein